MHSYVYSIQSYLFVVIYAYCQQFINVATFDFILKYSTGNLYISVYSFTLRPVEKAPLRLKLKCRPVSTLADLFSRHSAIVICRMYFLTKPHMRLIIKATLR